jgi:hypothetical protein
MKMKHLVAHNKWLEKICTSASLVILALGFALIGLVSFTTEHKGDVINGLPFENALFVVNSTISILIAATFSAAAFFYWRRYF